MNIVECKQHENNGERNNLIYLNTAIDAFIYHNYAIKHTANIIVQKQFNFMIYLHLIINLTNFALYI